MRWSRFRRFPPVVPLAIVATILGFVLLRFLEPAPLDLSEQARLLSEHPASIEAVIDAQTHHITHKDGSSDKIRVRLLGLSVRREAEAIAYLNEEVAGGAARFEFDRRRVSRDGILLAYVFANERCVNEELLKRGFAAYEPQPGDSLIWSKRLRAAAGGETRSQR